jgi:hypothetical protein
MTIREAVVGIDDLDRFQHRLIVLHIFRLYDCIPDWNRALIIPIGIAISVRQVVTIKRMADDTSQTYTDNKMSIGVFSDRMN